MLGYLRRELLLLSITCTRFEEIEEVLANREVHALSVEQARELAGVAEHARGFLLTALRVDFSSLEEVVGQLSGLVVLVESLRSAPDGLDWSAVLEAMTYLHVSSYHRVTFGVLDLIGAFPSNGRNLIQPEVIASLFESPGELLAREYGLDQSWTGAQVGFRIFPRLAFLFSECGLLAFSTSEEREGEIASALSIQLPLVPDDRDGSIEVCVLGLPGESSFSIRLRGSARTTVPISEAATLELSAAGSPGDLVVGRDGVTTTTGTIAVRSQIAVRSSEQPIVLFGALSRTRFTIREIVCNAHFGVGPSWDVGFGITVRGAKLVLVIRDIGEWLESIIGEEVVADLSFDVAWSVADGLLFRGGGSAEVFLQISLSIAGLVTIDGVRIRFLVNAEQIALSASASISFTLGPVAFAAEGIGARFAVAAFSIDGLSLGVTPPARIGVAIDAGCVSGGGGIELAPSDGRYVGCLSLSAFEIAVGAIGLLETRAAGVVGYSCLVLISATFTPIQLGFGFTLSGVGGICGVQRAVNLDSLRGGVRDGSLTPLLFTRDPVSLASRIVTAISAIFPATQDSYVFGPLFKLGWGTPTLVTITLGLVIKLPDPITIALIGQVEVRLPKPEAAIVEVNIDILGLLLPDEKLLSIDARLRDSKVAGWTLTGGMAFRLTWGAEPNFLFSVGGFNPHFRPPPSFPQIERLALALGTGSNPRVSLAAYFAITSNSLQFGARAELYAEALGFSIQGYLEFHALFIFSPFSFRFDFAAGVALKRGSSVIAGITVAGTLSGPRPWRVQGSASISLIFFDVSVSFDETFGQPAEPEQIEAVDAWTRLREALQDLRNWSAPLPVGTHRGVSTAADAETPARLCLDPLSGITLSQKILPLEQRISKLGEAPIVGGASVFRIARVRIGTEGAGGALIDTAPHRDSFAAAQYQPLTDSERLSRPSYEPMIAGVESRADIARSGVGAVVDRQWQTVFMRSDDHMEGPASPAAAALMLEMSSATGGGLSAVGMDRFAAAPGTLPVVSMAPEMWVASSSEDLKPARDQAPSSSYSTAEGSLRVIEGADDSMTFQVVPAWEAA